MKVRRFGCQLGLMDFYRAGFLLSFCAAGVFGAFSIALAQESKQAKQASKAAQPRASSDEDTERLNLVTPPPRFWFPDWGIPEFDYALIPILGASYESNKVTRIAADPDSADGSQTFTSTRRQLTLEAGARFYLNDIPLVNRDRRGSDQPTPARTYDLPPSPLAMTISPYVGYAFGRVTEVEVNDDDAKRLGLEPLPKRNGNYHRVLAGAPVTTYYRYFRYRIGVDFARIFGDREILEPRTQTELEQDFGFKLTERTSAHLSPTVGRIFTKSFSEHSLQYTDIWLHLRWNPFFSVALDLGPGQGFDWYPMPGFGSEATYFKAQLDWEIFGPLAVAARARYEINVNNNFDSSTRDDEDSNQTRSPMEDLGRPSTQALRFTDDLSLLLFAGLKNIIGGISVGYVSLHEFSNTFERKGKRTSQSSQGLGVQASLEI
jgi:hypothetical protein